MLAGRSSEQFEPLWLKQIPTRNHRFPVASLNAIVRSSFPVKT